MTKENQENLSLKERPPIVAILGHVDHGKSTLLDYIRKSNTVDSEHGGITQHVAAYEVKHEHEGRTKRITFIDTPGHAAFKSIRARGAKISDIAILVVAADDGVNKQTIEALESIKKSDTPFVVAINKIDKSNADVERTKTSLLEAGVYLEGFGGDVPYATISAKTGKGISDLLDLVLLSAEMEELRGDASVNAEGYIIEAHRDTKKGIATTVIITNGKMQSGQVILSGNAMAPLRIMQDYAGNRIKEAEFSTPVTIIGFDELPEVGTRFSTYENKKIAEKHKKEFDENAHKQTKQKTESEDGAFVLPLIIKADTSGSLEAIEHELSPLDSEHKKIQIVHKGIGNISENDIKLALADSAHSLLIGFNVGVDSAAEDIAKQFSIQTKTFNIIYNLTKYVSDSLTELSPIRDVEKVIGEIKVLKYFSSKKDVHLIGGKVTNGVINRGCLVNIIRDEEKIGTGEIINIQSGKQTVEKLDADSEFGAQIESIVPIQSKDTLECFKIEKEQ